MVRGGFAYNSWCFYTHNVPWFLPLTAALGKSSKLQLERRLGWCPAADLFHRNRRQGNHRAEHVVFDKFRGPAGVELCVFISIPHPGPQLVRQSNLTEHFGAGRILGIRLKRGQIQDAIPITEVSHAGKSAWCSFAMWIDRKLLPEFLLEWTVPHLCHSTKSFFHYSNICAIVLSPCIQIPK